jgi:hypothetical protein
MNILAPNTVLVTTAELRNFKASWPCSGIPADVCVAFEFDFNGNLVDVKWFDEDGIDVAEPEADGSAVSALSQGAQKFLEGKEGEIDDNQFEDPFSDEPYEREVGA